MRSTWYGLALFIAMVAGSSAPTCCHTVGAEVRGVKEGESELVACMPLAQAPGYSVSVERFGRESFSGAMDLGSDWRLMFEFAIKRDDWIQIAGYLVGEKDAVLVRVESGRGMDRHRPMAVGLTSKVTGVPREMVVDVSAIWERELASIALGRKPVRPGPTFGGPGSCVFTTSEGACAEVPWCDDTVRGRRASRMVELGWRLVELSKASTQKALLELFEEAQAIIAELKE